MPILNATVMRRVFRTTAINSKLRFLVYSGTCHPPGAGSVVPRVSVSDSKYTLIQKVAENGKPAYP
jgi:hypothetical protein